MRIGISPPVQIANPFGPTDNIIMPIIGYTDESNHIDFQPVFSEFVGGRYGH